MKTSPFTALLLLLVMISSCSESKTQAQTQNISTNERVGGECEGCEAIHENTKPFTDLYWQITLPGYNSKGPKLHITGTVYTADGKTPAAGTILYFYHTDQFGNYPQKGDEKGWARRHGYIRGWIKTNAKGQYAILTIKPAAYPNRQTPAHIHCIIKEKDLNEYYIGDFLFDDDPLVSNAEKTNIKVPAGNGVLKLEKKNGILYGVRDIYLGRNIRGYPVAINKIKK